MIRNSSRNNSPQYFFPGETFVFQLFQIVEKLNRFSDPTNPSNLGSRNPIRRFCLGKVYFSICVSQFVFVPVISQFVFRDLCCPMCMFLFVFSDLYFRIVFLDYIFWRVCTNLYFRVVLPELYFSICIWRVVFPVLYFSTCIPRIVIANSYLPELNSFDLYFPIRIVFPIMFSDVFFELSASDS